MESEVVLEEVHYRKDRSHGVIPVKPTFHEQRRAFESFRRVWTASSLLDGVYVWNWYGYGGPTSISYTPRGKPAEVEVKLLLKDL